ncbi:MAG: zf-HC2 domain-containing protein [Pseudomonadota bacterium]
MIGSSVVRRVKGLMMRHMHGMITCIEFESFIMRYLDGELTVRERRVFEWHLRLCRECRDYLAAYQQTLAIEQAVLGDAGAPVPADVPEDLIRAVLDAREK